MSVAADIYLTRAELVERGIRFTNYYLLKLERANKFPPRTRLGHKTVVWRKSAIDEFMASKDAEARARAALPASQPHAA